MAFFGNTLVRYRQPGGAANVRAHRAVTPATAPPMPQPPTITQVVNAIDFRTNYSPGALVSVMGNYLRRQCRVSQRRREVASGCMKKALMSDINAIIWCFPSAPSRRVFRPRNPAADDRPDRSVASRVGGRTKSKTQRIESRQTALSGPAPSQKSGRQWFARLSEFQRPTEEC